MRLAEWYSHQLKLLNVPVTLNTRITKELALTKDYDAVIVATGSTPKVISLGDDEHVYTAADVLTGEKDPGESTVVIGGGLVGCETALWLAQKGKKVTIVEALDKLLAVNAPLCHANSEMLERLIPYNNIGTITSAKVTGYENGKLSINLNGKTKELNCDSVILSIGYKPENSLYQQLQFDVPEIYMLGDAKNVANIMYAIWDAFEVANSI
jgi:2-enoate reductase